MNLPFPNCSKCLKTGPQPPAKQRQQHWATGAQLIAELNNTLVDLQTQNPTVAIESQALTIIDTEFIEIQQGRASRLAVDFATHRRFFPNVDLPAALAAA
jgi:hypothetical protein